jgi:glycolate oxidase FAD binding subunit
MDDPALRDLIERVRAARADGTTLDIRGGGTKAWYGEAPAGEPLATGALRGISSYEPSELVVTVRAGTPLPELEAALAEKGQCLPFEPPRFGAASTVGGMVAAGLAGPARAAVGGVRDYVLGATVLNGRAEVLSFGGQVMKNVAGYDVSRLLAGSMGVLGVICEVSLKVLPRPVATATLRFDVDEAEAIRRLNAWGGQPLPLSASAWHGGVLHLRLAGAAAAVASAARQLGGQPLGADEAAALWEALRDQRSAFFAEAQRAVDAGGTLWRLSVPSVAPPLALPGPTLLEWGGAQRWCFGDLAAERVRAAAAAAGGHATALRTGDATLRAAGVFAPLAAPLERIHRDLKRTFDPAGILNPGRLYPGW